MRNLFLLLLTASLLGFYLVPLSNAQAVRNETALPASALPQAEPVYNPLKAIDVSDFKLYQSAWTSDTLDMYREHKKDWKRIRREYQKMFRKDLGHYRVEDLRYSYESRGGLNMMGVIHIIYKGKKRVGFNVQIENGKWKIAEM
jgi:hypothetical protein